jgi:hypothetical protein
MPQIFALLMLLLAIGVTPANALDEADAPIPNTLTFGYEGEGQADASPASCLAYAKNFEGSHQTDMKAAAKEVCDARQHHIDAYAAVQKSYRRLVDAVGGDGGVHAADAARAFQTMIAACIDHKSDLVHPGRQEMLDVIPNEIATRCLELGKRVLEDETTFLAGDVERVSP